MNNTQNFESKSYDSHAGWYDARFPDQASKEKFLLNGSKQGTIAHWDDIRFLKVLEPFLKEKSTWLTVGDAYGTDANYLMTKSQTATASDISGGMFETAKQLGIITSYAVENAEKMSFADNSFDYVFCRESFHHFPRPYLALYEMIRVSKKAVIMVEPIDILQTMPAILWLKNILDRFNVEWINKIWKNRFSFETVGNYVYKISEREIEKTAMGINLRSVAFYKLNDFDKTKPVGNEVPPDKKVFRKIKRDIGIKNFLAKLGVIPYYILCPVIFKQEPSEQNINDMKLLQFKYIRLPKNPYLK